MPTELEWAQQVAALQTRLTQMEDANAQLTRDLNLERDNSRQNRVQWEAINDTISRTLTRSARIQSSGTRMRTLLENIREQIRGKPSLANLATAIDNVIGSDTIGARLSQQWQVILAIRSSAQAVVDEFASTGAVTAATVNTLDNDLQQWNPA